MKTQRFGSQIPKESIKDFFLIFDNKNDLQEYLYNNLSQQMILFQTGGSTSLDDKEVKNHSIRCD